jgi:hypothetical protein
MSWSNGVMEFGNGEMAESTIKIFRVKTRRAEGIMYLFQRGDPTVTGNL